MIFSYNQRNLKEVQAPQTSLNVSNEPGKFTAAPVGNISRFFSEQYAVILFLIMLIQALKGTAVYQGPYPRAHYLWNYQEGFIKRGLIGSIVMYLADGDSYRLLGIVNFVSYFSYFAFLFVLYRFMLTQSRNVTEKFVTLLFVASPFLQGMGTLLGYFDSCVLLLLIYLSNLQLENRAPFWKIIILIVVGLCVHELALVFIVVPLAFQILVNPNLINRVKIFRLFMITAICLLYLGLTYKQNIAFTEVLTSRLTNYAHVLQTKSGERKFIEYGKYAIQNNFMHDFALGRLKLLEAFFPIYGVFIVVISIMGAMKLVQCRKYFLAFLFVVSCYFPLLILLVAWDVERFICFTCLTAYLSYLTMARFYNVSIQIPYKSIVYVGIVAVCALNLLTAYPMADFYAESETVLSKNKQRFLFHYPARYIQFWFDKHAAERH